MTRTRVRPIGNPRAGHARRRTAVALTVTVIGAVWAGPIARALPGDAERVSRSTVVVEPGDSLWSIASEAAPGADPRPLVDAIAAENHVDGADLVPGQTLVIPAG